MAILIEGKFKDLYEYSNGLYVKIDELCVKRSLGIIEVKLQLFMNSASARNYRVHSMKNLTQPTQIIAPRHCQPVNPANLKVFKTESWVDFKINLNHTLLAFQPETETVEVPTYNLVDAIEEHVDFDDKGNQILISHHTKKPVKKIHRTKKQVIYKISQEYLNNPYTFAYVEIRKYLTETFKNYNIKNI